MSSIHKQLSELGISKHKHPSTRQKKLGNFIATIQKPTNLHEIDELRDFMLNNSELLGIDVSQLSQDAYQFLLYILQIKGIQELTKNYELISQIIERLNWQILTPKPKFEFNYTIEAMLNKVATPHDQKDYPTKLEILKLMVQARKGCAITFAPRNTALHDVYPFYTEKTQRDKFNVPHTRDYEIDELSPLKTDRFIIFQNDGRGNKCWTPIGVDNRHEATQYNQGLTPITYAFALATKPNDKPLDRMNNTILQLDCSFTGSTPEVHPTISLREWDYYTLDGQFFDPKDPFTSIDNNIRLAISG